MPQRLEKHLPRITFALLLTTSWAFASAAQEQFPADMPAEDRSLAKAEMPMNKSYCEHHEILSIAFDCDCFAKAVLHYHAAHFKEHPAKLGYYPLNALLTGEQLDCKECLSPAGLAKWAAEQDRPRLLLMTAKDPKGKNRLTPAVEKAVCSCVVKSVTKSFRERPFVSLFLDQYQQAFYACQKQYLPPKAQ